MWQSVSPVGVADNDKIHNFWGEIKYDMIIAINDRYGIAFSKIGPWHTTTEYDHGIFSEKCKI